MKKFIVDENALIEIPFIFKDIKKEDTRKILENLQYSLENYKKDEKIFDSENFIHSIAFILSGNAEVYRGDSRKKTLLSSLSKGDSFGASALFGESESFPTTIYAKSDCTIMFINQENVQRLILEFPQIALNYISFLSGKIRFLNDKINSFSSRSAEEKTAKFLLENERDGVLFSELNVKQISSSLGLGRASFYRIISSFEERNLVKRDGSQIFISNKKGLMSILDNK